MMNVALRMPSQITMNDVIIGNIKQMFQSYHLSHLFFLFLLSVVFFCANPSISVMRSKDALIRKVNDGKERKDISARH